MRVPYQDKKGPILALLCHLLEAAWGMCGIDINTTVDSNVRRLKLQISYPSPVGSLSCSLSHLFSSFHEVMCICVLLYFMKLR